MSRRLKIYNLLEMQDDDSLVSKLVNAFIMVLILMNVAAVILETVTEYQIKWHLWFATLEVFSVTFFTLEYVTRLWCCVESSHYGGGFRGRLRYFMTPMAVIDLLAILPFYLNIVFPLDTRILRVLRLLRVFKLSRHFAVLGVLGTVLRNEARTLISAIFVLQILVVIAATGIYLAERHVQPEEFGNIPRAMWWATVTLTTVGYGDLVPITSTGRFLGMLITIIGVGMAALPAGIIASGFTGEVARRRERYAHKTKELFQDGVIDSIDKKTLKKIREELGIDRSDAQHILRKTILESAALHEADIHCPHCGKGVVDRHHHPA